MTVPRFRFLSLLLLATFLLCACNPIFVIRAAYEQSKILVARRPISEVVADPTTSDDDRIKLQLVVLAREFAQSMELEPGKGFTDYTRLNTDPVAWVISASKKDAFEPYTWWFPIVGSVPYKAFFEKDDAIEASKALEEGNIETWVRGTAAFSTLGWFNDPLLSSTLKLPTADVVNTVIHETVHATVWIPGSVAFNESLANFVGTRAAIDFFEWIATRADTPISEPRRLELLAEAKLDFERELDASDYIHQLYDALSELYQSDVTTEEKILQRDQVLNQRFAGFRRKYPGVLLIPKVNNAEIMQRKLYLTKLRSFEALFLETRANWKDFIGLMKNIRDEPGEDEDQTFALLDKRRETE